MHNAKYAVLQKKSGQLHCTCETMEQVNTVLSIKKAEWEVRNISRSSHLKVVYTELGGPWGYGHQEPSFETYGPLLICIIRLYKWMQEESSFWGPDPRDVRDYFKHCSLYINGKSYSDWLFKQVENINMHTLYI